LDRLALVRRERGDVHESCDLGVVAGFDSWHELEGEVKKGVDALSRQFDAADRHLDRFDEAADRQMNAEMEQIEASLDLMNADLDQVWMVDKKVAASTKEES